MSFLVLEFLSLRMRTSTNLKTKKLTKLNKALFPCQLKPRHLKNKLKN